MLIQCVLITVTVTKIITESESKRFQRTSLPLGTVHIQNTSRRAKRWRACEGGDLSDQHRQCPWTGGMTTFALAWRILEQFPQAAESTLRELFDLNLHWLVQHTQENWPLGMSVQTTPNHQQAPGLRASSEIVPRASTRGVRTHWCLPKAQERPRQSRKSKKWQSGQKEGIFAKKERRVRFFTHKNTETSLCHQSGTVC